MFYVWMYNHSGGKEREMKEWIKKVLEPFFAGIPEVRSVKTFMRRIGLGPRIVYETWIEIPNFAFLDRYLEVMKRADGWKVIEEFLALSEDFSTKIVFQL